MRIDNTNVEAKKEYQNELKRLDQANRRLEIAKERDLENLKKVYQRKEETIKEIGDQRLIELRDDTTKRQHQELQNNEEVLNKYKIQLNDTVEQLEKQRLQLTEAQRQQMKNQQLNFSETVSDRQSELEELSNEINTRANDQIKDIAQKSQYQLSDQTFKTQAKLDTLAHQHDLKVQDQARVYGQKEKDEALKYYQSSAMAQLQHQKEMSTQQLKNNVEFGQRQSIHQKQIENLEQFNSQKIRDQHESFKQKITALTQEQEMMLKNIDNKFKKEVEDLVAGHSNKKRDLASKLQDSFYHVSTIEPKLVETEKNYLISIALPEHEKDGARLTAHDRIVRLNFTRNFDDEFKDADGTIHKSKRSEVISKEFNVAEIVESKKITQKYENGLLTFVLPKK